MYKICITQHSFWIKMNKKGHIVFNHHKTPHNTANSVSLPNSGTLPLTWQSLCVIHTHIHMCCEYFAHNFHDSHARLQRAPLASVALQLHPCSYIFTYIHAYIFTYLQAHICVYAMYAQSNVYSCVCTCVCGASCEWPISMQLHVSFTIFKLFSFIFG